MGIADRDYMRSSSQSGSNRRSIAGITALLLLVTILVVPATRHWIQERFGSTRPLVFTYKPLGLGPALTLGQPYPINDEWKVPAKSLELRRQRERTLASDDGRAVNDLCPQLRADT